MRNRIYTFFKNGKHRNSLGISITRSILYFPFIRFFPSRHTSSKGHSHIVVAALYSDNVQRKSYGDV